MVGGSLIEMSLADGIVNYGTLYFAGPSTFQSGDLRLTY